MIVNEYLVFLVCARPIPWYCLLIYPLLLVHIIHSPREDRIVSFQFVVYDLIMTSIADVG